MTNKGTGGRLFFLVVLFLHGAAIAPQPPAAHTSAAPWSLTGGMTMVRVYQSSIALSDGRVLAIGGVDGAGRILASAEIYDPRTGRWSVTGRISSGRAGMTAALLPNGTVLVAGGASGTFGRSSVVRSAELYDPHTGRWRATGRMTTPRYNYAVAVLRNGRVLVCGGVDAAGQALRSAELYDPRTGAWHAAGGMTVARAAQTATLLPDGRVLVAGGASGAFGSASVLRSAELYDPSTGRWRATGSMSEARAVHTATLLPSGNVLVAGGESGQSDSSSVRAGAELYHPRTGTWTPAGHLEVPRYNQTATLLPDGRVLVAGGQDESVAGQSLANAELYDPAAHAWMLAPSMTTARTGHSAALLPDGRVLVAGGDTQDAAGPTTSSAEVYDPGAPTGSVPPVARPRAQFTATLLRDGRVLVTGGVYALPSTLARSSAELYDSRTGVWSLTGSMIAARASQTATLLRDGRVLVAGGFDSAGILASAELYDARSGHWSTTGRMAAARASQTATLLPDGRVLVAGGVSGKANSVLASAEVYDPHTGHWTRTGSMSDARAGHTATLLPGGKVLVTGGQEDVSSGAALYSAEVYNPRRGAWSEVSQMTQARVKHTATLLPDGRVLVAGGEAMPNATLNVVEVYDPRSGTWTGASGMTAARAYHAAVLLANGKVLVAGGVVAGDQTLASAEVFTPRTGVWTTTGSM